MFVFSQCWMLHRLLSWWCIKVNVWCYGRTRNVRSLKNALWCSFIHRSLDQALSFLWHKLLSTTWHCSTLSEKHRVHKEVLESSLDRTALRQTPAVFLAFPFLLVSMATKVITWILDIFGSSKILATNASPVDDLFIPREADTLVSSTTVWLPWSVVTVVSLCFVLALVCGLHISMEGCFGLSAFLEQVINCCLVSTWLLIACFCRIISNGTSNLFTKSMFCWCWWDAEGFSTRNTHTVTWAILTMMDLQTPASN